MDAADQRNFVVEIRGLNLPLVTISECLEPLRNFAVSFQSMENLASRSDRPRISPRITNISSGVML